MLRHVALFFLMSQPLAARAAGGDAVPGRVVRHRAGRVPVRSPAVTMVPNKGGRIDYKGAVPIPLPSAR